METQKTPAGPAGRGDDTEAGPNADPAGGPQAAPAGASHPGPTAGRPFRRRREGRLLGGVAAGLADQFELDVAAVRVAIVAASVLAGVGVPLYLAAWLLLPEEDRDVSLAEEWWAQFEGRPAAHEEPSGAR